MYVEEVCIDGFKSYAQRTVVPQFDQYFNAITGLNGSGKSNILDSICFVLGITNLSQVRRKPSSFTLRRRFFFVVGGVLFYRRSTQKGALLPNVMCIGHECLKSLVRTPPIKWEEKCGRVDRRLVLHSSSSSL